MSIINGIIAGAIIGTIIGTIMPVEDVLEFLNISKRKLESFTLKQTNEKYKHSDHKLLCKEMTQKALEILEDQVKENSIDRTIITNFWRNRNLFVKQTSYGSISFGIVKIEKDGGVLDYFDTDTLENATYFLDNIKYLSKAINHDDRSRSYMESKAKKCMDNF